MKLSQLKIDPEFQSKIPPLQFEEEQQLEQNIIAEGRLLNPISTWNGYILDGHTRYRILKKHGFIKFEVEEIQLANKYEALASRCFTSSTRRGRAMWIPMPARLKCSALIWLCWSVWL